MRRGLAIGAWLAALAVCVAIAATTRFVADLSSFLPSAPTAEQRLLVDQLREGAVSRMMLVGIEGADPAARAAISRSMAKALREDARFSFVANGAGAGFERERDLLLAHRYALSPRVDTQRFTVEGLRAAVGDTLDLLASPAGLLAKALVPRDPTGELFAVIEQLTPQGGPNLVEGAWASADGRRAILVARTKASGGDTDAQAAAIAAMQAAFEKARAETEATDARLLLTGPGVFSARSRAMIEHDVSRLSAVSAALVIALLLVAYRSGRALALGLVPVVTGALVGIAAVSLGFGAVHGITLGFGTTLIGEAVDYSIYLFVQTPGSRLWPTIRLGVLASIAGFSALVFSGLPGLAQLGVYSICGLVAAALTTRYVLPAMLPAGFQVRDLSPVGVKLLAATRVAQRGRWLVAVLALAAAAVLLLHRGALWDRDIASLNPIGEGERRVDMELRAALGASDARHMIAVRGANADAALAAAEQVTRTLDPLVAAGTLGGYESPSHLLPPERTQRERLAALPDASALRTRLAQALQGLPLQAARLEPFIEDVQRARAQAPLTAAQVSGTAIGAALEGLLFPDRDGRWNALVGLRPPEGRGIDAAAVRQALERAGVKDAFVLDLKAEVDRLYAGYFERALVASAAGFAVIVALLFAALRSPARVAAVLAPLAAGVLVIAALHALAGSRLSLLHLVALLLVVAVGSNYALFFDQVAGRRDDGVPRTLASLGLANLTTVASFGTLSLSSIPVLSAIGSTVAAGAFLTLLFSAAASRHGIIRP